MDSSASIAEELFCLPRNRVDTLILLELSASRLWRVMLWLTNLAMRFVAISLMSLSCLLTHLCGYHRKELRSRLLVLEELVLSYQNSLLTQQCALLLFFSTAAVIRAPFAETAHERQQYRRRRRRANNCVHEKQSLGTCRQINARRQNGRY